MSREQILETIRTLAKSQGKYGIILRSLGTMKEKDPEAYDRYMDVLESKNFKDAVELVMFFEGA